MPPKTVGSRRPSTLRLTPLRTRTRTGAMLSGDQRVEGATDVLGRNGDVEARAVVAEEDEPELAADVLLVALHRRPRLVPVDADRLRREDLLHLTRVASGEAKGGEEAEGDRLAVADAV